MCVTGERAPRERRIKLIHLCDRPDRPLTLLSLSALLCTFEPAHHYSLALILLRTRNPVTRRHLVDCCQNMTSALAGYCPGGFHPVSVGDVLAGQYKVLHKLGFGGPSTVWLARDNFSREDLGSLVALKILSVEQSSMPTTEITDLYVLPHVLVCSKSLIIPAENIFLSSITISHGPNVCLISQFAGPSLFSMLKCPGRLSGSKRLRADLARNVARQVANAVDLLHSA